MAPHLPDDQGLPDDRPLPDDRDGADDLARAFERYQAGDLAGADAACERVLAREPATVPALQILSLVRFAEQRIVDAIGIARQAIAAAPDDPDSHNNLGAMLARLGQHREALEQYDRAVERAPGYAAVWLNRGNALWELNRLHEAAISYDRALACQPDYVEALYNRATAALALRHLHEAVLNYGRVLEIRPDYPGALHNRSAALAELKQHDAALQDIQHLLTVAPDYDFARGTALRLAQEACDWRTPMPTVADIETDIRAGKRSAAPFALLGMSSSPDCHLAGARTWIRHRHPPAPAALWRNEIYRHEKIRVAYLSADFCDHATSYLMAGLLERHDRDRFEIVAMSFGPDDRSAVRQRIFAAVDDFIDVSAHSNQEAAQMLREREVDIAVDLKGLTTACRPGILALRPAPVQVNYLGYPGTMAADYIDYIIADRSVIPPGQDIFYTEKIVYLPDTYQATDDRRQIAPRRPTRTEAGLPETAFVFASFNSGYKITPAMFDVWMRLLRDIGSSVLWLLDDNAAAIRNLRAEAAARGVAPTRLVFAPKVPAADHLARLPLADLMLDTLPYNGHTTTSDALWAGRPVLTCRGAAFAGRVAASLLAAIGLPELITDSLADYEALARRLATNRPALAQLQETLNRNRATHALFDTDRFRRHLEQAYFAMWERTQRGELPASFAVAPGRG